MKVQHAAASHHWNGAFLSRGSDRTRKYRTIYW
jgi:hypothetical protein